MIPGVFAAQAAAGGGGELYLDDLAVLPQAVLSLTKLVSTATVPVRVRRSSDNAEQDIGFDGRDLDVGSLTTFAGGSSAYVVRVYDQTGNGFHAEQPVAGAQARILDSGAYEGLIRHDNVDDCFKVTSLTMGTAFAGLYFFGAQPANHGDPLADILFELTDDYVATNGSFSLSAQQSANNYEQAMRQAGTHSNHRYEMALESPGQISALWDRAKVGAGQFRAWKNGVELIPVSTQYQNTGGTFISSNFWIGARGGTSRFSRLAWRTAVIYNADTAAVRDEIEDALS